MTSPINDAIRTAARAGTFTEVIDDAASGQPDDLVAASFNDRLRAAARGQSFETAVETAGLANGAESPPAADTPAGGGPRGAAVPFRSRPDSNAWMNSYIKRLATGYPDSDAQDWADWETDPEGLNG